MTTAGKIRVLLGLLFASLLFTAIFAEKTYTPANNLAQTGKVLEANLHVKERYVYDALADKKTAAELQSLTAASPNALTYINDFSVTRNIWFSTIKAGKIKFYSGAKIFADPNNRIKEGHSFIKYKNGYYETI